MHPVPLPPRNPFFRRLLVMKRTPVVVAFFFAAFLLGLYVMFQTPTTETFTDAKEIGEPVQSGVVPIGGRGVESPLPIKPAPYEVTEDEKLFAFDENRISPSCCPSPFVSDLGCICVTEKQNKDFASRGGNGNV